MKRITISLMLMILGVMLVSLLVSTVHAGSSFRCSDSSLISYGDSYSYCLQHCGQPTEEQPLVNALNQEIGVRLIYIFSIYGTKKITTIDYYYDRRMNISEETIR